MLQMPGCFVFVQAEDGIRDLVRSRGVGDVYKRQVVFTSKSVMCVQTRLIGVQFGLAGWLGRRPAKARSTPRIPASRASRFVTFVDPVSYTHLTLPTRDLV